MAFRPSGEAMHQPQKEVGMFPGTSNFQYQPIRFGIVLVFNRSIG